MNTVIKILIPLSILSLTACQSTVKYDDASKVETVNESFGSTDLQNIAKDMVDNMLAFPAIVELTRTGRPIIFVDTIKNKTSEHIDTESITDTISDKLLHSGRFNFIDMTKMETVKAQLNYQNSSGLVDPSKAVQFGRQLGAEFMLYGNLSSIVKEEGKVKDVYYKITLRLMNLENGLMEWSGEKEIRKTKTKSFFGS